MYNYDPYSQLRQSSYNIPSTIQNLSQTVATQSQTYFVNSPKDMEKIQPALNVMYIGINKDKNEIYLRQINNAGLIDFSTYSLITGEQEKNDFAKIMERIDKLETKIGVVNANNTTNGTVNGSDANAGTVSQPSTNATV